MGKKKVDPWPNGQYRRGVKGNETMKTRKRIQYLVNVMGTESYVPTPKSTIKQLEKEGHKVTLDSRFDGVIYIEIEQP